MQNVKKSAEQGVTPIRITAIVGLMVLAALSTWWAITATGSAPCVTALGPQTCIGTNPQPLCPHSGCAGVGTPGCSTYFYYNPRPTLLTPPPANCRAYTAGNSTCKSQYRCGCGTSFCDEGLPVYIPGTRTTSPSYSFVSCT